MRNRRTWTAAAVAFLVCVAAAGMLLEPAVEGQDLQRVSLDEFQQAVLPVLSKNCIGCHGDVRPAGGLSLEAFRLDPASALHKPAVWSAVLGKLESGTMPPPVMPPLAPADRAALVGWIGRLDGMSAGGAPPRGPATAATADPGRVTARRLNRTEYNNTLRDLLGVTIRPADEFPVDDAGYGFDNIGDALSMSPLLMEKYMSAARTVSRVAVYGETFPPRPTRLTRLLPKKFQDDTPAVSPVLPYAFRGSSYGTLHVPVDAEYEVRFRYQDFRGGPSILEEPDYRALQARRRAALEASRAARAAAGRSPSGGAPSGGAAAGAPPAPDADEPPSRKPADLLTFRIDGALAYSTDETYVYSHGDNIFRVKLAAGDHAVRLSWPALANLADPRMHVNPDLRRKIYVDYIDVIGPFSPSTAPPASFRKIFICGAPGRYTPSCAREIVQSLVTRAYRRPATTAEVERLLALAQQVQRHDSFEESIRVVVETLLMSPSFLFRIEQDQPPLAAGGTAGMAGATSRAYPVSDYELASRLSYFLWSSMPDEALFQAAASHQLRQPDVLDGQLKRMLADPKSAALVENFAGQWLNLRLMDRKKPDAQKFNVVDDELLDAMRQETLLFVGAIFRENQSILDFIDGKFTFVNGPLARYYGIKGVDGEAFQRVELDGTERSGILTQGSVLTIASYATRTSPVLRGKWVLDTLLGASPPPPPPNVPALGEADLGTAVSMRERLAQHRADPSCAACHNQMDPIGLGLENYDAAGAWRTREGKFDIDSSATLPDGRSFIGAKGLKETLRAQPDAFARHFTDRLLTYALGRGLEASDAPVVAEIGRALAADRYRFMTLVAAVVNSRPFQMRSRTVTSGGTS